MKLYNGQTFQIRTLSLLGQSVWHRVKGSSVWEKSVPGGEGALKSSDQMAAALRYFTEDYERYMVSFTEDDASCTVEEFESWEPVKRSRPVYYYRCAGCGESVGRRHRAKEGRAVWCGGSSCLNSRELRITLGGDIGRAVQKVFRELGGPCSSSCQDRLVPVEEEPPRGVGHCACHHEEFVTAGIGGFDRPRLRSEEVRALLEDERVQAAALSAVGSGGEAVVAQGVRTADGLVIRDMRPAEVLLESERQYIGGGRKA